MTVKLSLEDSPFLLDEHGPIFIVGCPRSGTTFLEDCIAAARQVEAFTGVLVSPRLLHLVGDRASRGEDVAPLLLAMRDNFWQAFWRRVFFFSERVGEVAARQKPLSNLFQRPHLDGISFCYKEPFLCFAIDQVAQHFPKAKFLHIVRDGRDCADSLERTYTAALSDEVLTDERLAQSKNSEIGVYRRWEKYFMPWWIPTGREAEFISHSTYGRCVWMWKEMVARAANCGHTLGSTRYLELSYNELVSAPREHSQRIVDFLHIGDMPRLVKRMDRALTTSVGINKRRQTQERIDEANQIAGDLFRQFGYGA
jgi:Sulfotransferase family